MLASAEYLNGLGSRCLSLNYVVKVMHAGKKLTSQKCKHMFLILLSWPFKHGSQWCFCVGSIFQSAGFSLVATHFSLTFSNLGASIVCWMFEQIDSTHCRAITAINWERTHFSLEFFALSPPSLHPFIPPSSPAPHVQDFLPYKRFGLCSLSLSLSPSLMLMII